MDETQYKERVNRLEEVNKIIEKLDPAIREQAFALLKPYITGLKHSAHDENEDGEAGGGASPSAEEFFSKHEHGKPADNAMLLAAYQYSQYGSAPFSIEEMKNLATDVGVTIPERLDMTYTAAKREGKSLFKKISKGNFKLTVHGEGYLKQTFQVTKGKKKKEPSESAE